MDYSDSLKVFQAQTKNVRALDQAGKQINRAINQALRTGDPTSASVHTKILALTFSAWAEARFSKLIHTPHGFELDEIRQIKDIQREKGLEAGWEKCLDLALKKVSASKKSNELPNKRQQILKIIKAYIIEPSLLRNKIAHGQWVVALNRYNDAENPEFTQRLKTLDAIAVSIWLRAYEYLARIVEDLIESPNRAFRRDYWLHLAELESFLDESAKWSLDDKAKKLRLKPSRLKPSSPETDASLASCPP